MPETQEQDVQEVAQDAQEAIFLDQAKMEFGDEFVTEITSDAGQEGEEGQVNDQPDNEEPEQQEQQNEVEKSYSDDVLAIARDLGWKDKDHFSDPDKYVDPVTFIKKEREFRRESQETNRELRKELQQLRKIVEESVQSKKQEESGTIDGKIDELTDEIRNATEYGDVDKVLELQEQLFELKQKQTAKPKDEKPDTENQENDSDSDPEPLAVAFIEKNKDWWFKDPDAKELAQELDRRYMAQGMSVKESLEKVQEEMDRYLEKRNGGTKETDEPTPKPKPKSTAAAVESPTPRTTGKASKITVRTADPDLLRAADQAVRSGIFDSIEEALDGLKTGK